MFRRPQFADALSWLLFLSVGVLTAEAEPHPGRHGLEAALSLQQQIWQVASCCLQPGRKPESQPAL